MAGVHVGDTNTRILITIVDEDGVIVPLGTASLLELILYKPNNQVITKTLSLFTDGADGKVYYDTIAGDLDIHGLWRYQAHIILPTGEKHSSILSMRVMPNL